MRANSSMASLVVVLILASGCRPAEDQTITVVPSEPTVPEPAPSQDVVELVRDVEPARAAQSQASINEIRERSVQQDRAGWSAVTAAPSPPVLRLFFQCDDDVTFSVRGVGRRLEVFPPTHAGGYIVLIQQPSDSGVYATSFDAEFRMQGELATLVVGRDRYVDCVSNPAAAVWQAPSRKTVR